VLLLTADTIQRCNGSLADLRGRLSIHAAMRSLFLPTETDTSLPIARVDEIASRPDGSRPERAVARTQPPAPGVTTRS
jgi:hypothetical protein